MGAALLMMVVSCVIESSGSISRKMESGLIGLGSVDMVEIFCRFQPSLTGFLRRGGYAYGVAGDGVVGRYGVGG